MKYGLQDETIERIQSVFSRYPEITKAVLYGSRAKGNFKNGSDIDLTLVGNELSSKTVSKISIEIDDLMIPYIVDLGILANIKNQDLIDHINRVGVVFYERKEK